MKAVRGSAVLARHLWVMWRTGQVRFRLETFGLYYPSPPYARAWWKPELSVALLLLRRAPAYARWVLEMDSVRRDGAEGWWRDRRGHSR